MGTKSSLFRFLWCSAYAGLCAVLFWPGLAHMVKVWGKEDFNYCYLVPVMVLYLVWEKRRELSLVPTASSWHGLVPLLLGIVLFWLGELGGEYYTQYLAAWLVLVGFIGILFGLPKLMVLRFPLLFLILMFPPPSAIYNNLTLQLKLISSRLGVQMLQLAGMPAYREGNVIDLGFTRLQVVDACSGLRYLFPLLALAIFVAHRGRVTGWKMLIIAASAIPLTIVTNSLRIASVGFLQPLLGPQVAEGFFHDFSGWLLFMVSVGLLMLEMKMLSRIGSEPTTRLPRADGLARKTHPVAPVVMNVIALLLLGGSAVMATTVDFREKVPLSRQFLEFPLVIDDWLGRRQSMEEQYLDALHLTDYLLADYSNGQGERVNLYVAYNDSQRKGASSHSPATCLPGSGWVFEESGLVNVAAGNKTVRVQRAVMRNGGDQMLVYYWFPQRGRILTSMLELKMFAFWDALVSRRSDGALVRLITPVSSGETSAAADGRLQRFAARTIPILNLFLPGH